MANNQRNRIFEGTFYFAQVFKQNMDKGGKFKKGGRTIQIDPRYKMLVEFDEKHLEKNKKEIQLVDDQGEPVTYVLREPTTLKTKRGDFEIGYHCEFTSGAKAKNGEERDPPRITDDFGNEWPGSRFAVDEQPLYIGNGSRGKVSIYEYKYGEEEEDVKPILNRIVVTELVEFEPQDSGLVEGKGFSLQDVQRKKVQESETEVDDVKVDPDEFFSEEDNEEE